MPSLRPISHVHRTVRLDEDLDILIPRNIGYADDLPSTPFLSALAVAKVGPQDVIERNPRIEIPIRRICPWMLMVMPGREDHPVRGDSFDEGS